MLFPALVLSHLLENVPRRRSHFLQAPALFRPFEGPPFAKPAPEHDNLAISQQRPEKRQPRRACKRPHISHTNQREENACIRQPASKHCDASIEARGSEGGPARKQAIQKASMADESSSHKGSRTSSYRRLNSLQLPISTSWSAMRLIASTAMVKGIRSSSLKHQESHFFASEREHSGHQTDMN